MEQLKKIFVAHAKDGRILSFRQLRAIAKDKKLKYKIRDLSRIRQQWMETAIYRRATRLRPEVFQSHSIPQFGLVQIDLAFYLSDERGHNDDAIGWLMAVCPATGLQHAVLIKDKTMPTCERAIRELVRESPFRQLYVIQSDSEAAITSDAFQSNMYNLHRIKFQFLVRGQKASFAERAIRTTKTDLSQTLSFNKTVRWVDHLLVVTEHHNEQPAFGTSFKRNSITADTFIDYLSERFGVEDASMAFNTTQIDIRSIIPKHWKEALFKFQLDQRVLLTRVRAEKVGEWLKKSERGTYGDVVYTVARAALRSAQQISHLVPGEKEGI
jgi:hypothetical protein